MQIINDDVETRIQRDIVANLVQREFTLAIKHILDVLEELYNGIPETKRTSYGEVYTIQVLSRYLFSTLTETDKDVFDIAATLFVRSQDIQCKGIALGILSLYGATDYEKVLPFFEASASSADWNLREFAQMFFRRLIQSWPDQMKEYLLRLTASDDPKIRRFVSETLRPVKENRWFYREPTYSLSILRNLFRESAQYPRTSVGNNLSDLARHLPELILGVVEDLVKSGAEDSYWIAYRACRSLVRNDPNRVMNLLGIDEYRYKKRVYRRSEYPGDQSKVNTSQAQED